MKKIVLASASPRRRELLGTMGIAEFEVRPSPWDEPAPGHDDPGKTVEYLAAMKARHTPREEGEVIIAADTLVYLDGEPLGKPGTPENAEKMLRTLSGRSHQVYTGVCVISDGAEIVEHECSNVEFLPLTEEEIAAYVKTGEPMDKAGAYGIQGRGCVLVKGISGDYFNIVGLPVCRLSRMLKSIGISVM